MKQSLKSLACVLLAFGLHAAAHAAANPWQATWIWNETGRENNYFRKVIVLDRQPSQAKIAITADNIYDLYINGVKVGSDADWTSLEVYDVTANIRKGKNTIAVKAVDPGGEVGGLIAECAVAYPDSSVTVVGTDSTWRISGQEAPGWTGAGFDDSGWKAPHEIGKPPIEPWGGIEHPALAPRVQLNVVGIQWPKTANPGDTLSVTCNVRPDRPIPVDSPVGLRLLSGGETVCEQWIEPDAPATQWKPGVVRTITFKAFRLPIYVPKGQLQAQVVTTATDTANAVPVWIGPAVKPVPVSQLDVTRLEARVSGRDLTIRAALQGVKHTSGMLLGLFRGRELWFASEVPSTGTTRVRLPEDLPGGAYEVRLLPHRAVSRLNRSASVKIAGLEKTGWRPFGWGTFVDRDGTPHRWYVSSTGTLIWDGKPYIPAGAMYLSRFFGEFSATNPGRNQSAFRQDMDQLRQMKEAGITDLYLNPCCRWHERPAWVWQRFADMCEEVGINYGLQVTNHIEPLKGYHIAQDEYVVQVKGGETATADITGTYCGRTDPANSVLYAAFDSSTGTLIDWGKARVSPGNPGIRAEAAPKAPAGAGVSVHFIPEYTFNGDMHDYWRGVNANYERNADTFFSALKLGPGFRLWIDPLDNEQSFREMNRMLPHSAEFRSMFAQYVKTRYDTVEKAMAAWAVALSSPSAQAFGFETLARLVPVGKSAKDSDVGYAVDEAAGSVYRVDLSKSAMWHDMLRFRDSSIAEFNCRVANMIKKHHNAPVVLKATDTDCFTNPRTNGGFDGLGMEAYGSAPELVRGCGGGVYSRCKQAGRTMWTLTTETGIAQDPCGYPGPVRMAKELASMLEMNAKGTFYFLLASPSGHPNQGWYVFNLFEDPRQLWWLGAYSKLIKSSATLPYYEPPVDYYFPGVLAGQRDGFARTEPDFYSDIPSQSVPGESGRWVVPASTSLPQDAQRVIVNLENTPATSIYGAAFEEALKTREVVVVGHRRDLGALSIDRYYTGRFVQDRDGSTIQVLSPTPTSQVFARAEDGSVCGLTDGNLTIYSKSGWVNGVRKTAGPAPPPNFDRQVLGMSELDLGRAFEGMVFGDTACVWNMTDTDAELALAVGPGERASVHCADGTTQAAVSEASLSLPANARRPVVIEGTRSVTLTGTDKANLAAALREWAGAREKAAAMGIEAPIVPESGDWRRIYRLADELAQKADDAYRSAVAPRMEAVKVDGDLAEWQQARPIYLQMDVGIDYAKRKDYDGARFYTGWDADFLYVAGEVTDEVVANNYRLDGLWNGDAIEVMVDLRPEANPNVWQFNSDCFQFVFAPTSKDGTPALVSKSPGLPPNHVPRKALWVVKKTDRGWQFEAGIHRGDINGFEFRPGCVLGFTVQLDDSDGGDRVSAKLWRGGKDASRNRLALGRLVLGK